MLETTVRTEAAVRWWLLPVIFLLGGLAGFLLLSVTRIDLGGEAGAPSGEPGAPWVGSEVAPAGGAAETGGEDPEAGWASERLERQRETALVRAARKAGPAVVSITVTQTRLVQVRPFGSLFDPFFPGWVPGRIYREEIPGLGSGVIVTSDGIILTNAHVVSEANEIKVTLTDGRTFDGTLVGIDASHDLAVIRIDGQELPVASIGDSESLMVGEWVVAIGNPFAFLLDDYNPTVTAGVVSAVHRDIRPTEETQAIYRDMIQTDAAINPGNSGGPLVNSLGEVVGINSFIFTKGGGSEGIGFAIPINLAISVVEEILEYGRVRQPWLGVTLRAISPYLAAYFQIRDRRGLLVWALEEGSPADAAGIRVADILREVNGKRVTTTKEFRAAMFDAQIGDTVYLTIEREDRRLEFGVVLKEAPARD